MFSVAWDGEKLRFSVTLYRPAKNRKIPAIMAITAKKDRLRYFSCWLICAQNPQNGRFANVARNARTFLQAPLNKSFSPKKQSKDAFYGR
jgi:hypothetical protein